MKTYQFKMYSNHGNRELHKTIDSHGQVWNHFVALCRRYYGIYGKYAGKKALMRHLTKLKRLSQFAHWHQLPSQSLQDVIDRLDKAYQKKFANPRRSGRPRFKKRVRYKSFTLKQAGWQLLPGNHIKIGKVIYSYFKSRDVLGNPKRCTIKRDAIGDVYITILTDSTCGVANKTLNLRDRHWQCSDCGTVHDRDRNAAINIYRVGASTLEGEDVRPSADGCPC